jgi:hypothetical protein
MTSRTQPITDRKMAAQDAGGEPLRPRAHGPRRRHPGPPVEAGGPPRYRGREMLRRSRSFHNVHHHAQGHNLRKMLRWVWEARRRQW